MPVAEVEPMKITAGKKRHMSTLIAEGVKLQKKIEKYQEEMDAIKKELMPMMCAMSGDTLTAKSGVQGGYAEYKRDENIVFVSNLVCTKMKTEKGWVFGDDIGVVRKACGPEFENLYVEAKVYKPKTSDIKEKLSSADDAIGNRLREITTVDKKESIQFRVN